MIGALDVKVWTTYVRAMGACIAATLLCCFVANQTLQVVATTFLAKWSSTLPKQGSVMTPDEEAASLRSLGIYALMMFGSLTSIVMRTTLFRHTSLKVSRAMHVDALWKVLRSPMSWLDTTPTGRVINRFSQDMQKLDMDTQGTTANFVDQLVLLAVSAGVVAFNVPLLLPFMLPLVFVYQRLQLRFRSTARELQRLASRAKSPIYQGLDEAILGVSSIRAFEQQGYFIQRNVDRTLLHISLMFNIMCCNRWLCVRLRLVGTIPIAGACLAMVLDPTVGLPGIAATGAMAGLVLQYALRFATSTEGFLQSLTQTELCLVAIERISTYGQLASEPALEVPAVDGGIGNWPPRGEIRFEEVVMRYRSDLPLVLNGISFTVPGGTSLGVVGRTGAGKSSLLQALFRMCELESGRIVIDGTDISSLGLHTLRRHLAIIPQDPVGFTGSVRVNLDPFSERQETELWARLKEVQLAEFIGSKEEGLDFQLSAGGENLSVGQMQLICAARAFLRNARILILDEATASVDFKTDSLIQQVLRDEVTKNSLTTVTIAHRINTIMGADNVLVMDRGTAAELGPPRALADDPKSVFYTFAHPAGSGGAGDA
mmetsp:Transcript_87634/g.268147  ORF Transcript_87634/g.268147 Transcript_87634/m.268147 type:complete len:600 (-) Transcript_87634:11-1810(-)